MGKTPTPTPTTPGQTPAGAPTPTPTPTPAPDDAGLALGPPDASTSALTAALDEPILTYVESGGAQLLSTAAPDGLSDPFGSAQAGWATGPQQVDPYTNVAAAGGTVNPFVGQDVDPYTNTPASGPNSNAFTGGQDVNPFTGGGTSSLSVSSPNVTLASDLAPSYSGANTSLLSSPNLLASNDIGAAVNPNVASDVGGPTYIGPTDAGVTGASANTDFTPQISDTASDTGGSTYIGSFTENGVTYYQFADISGFIYEIQADGDTTPSTAPSGTPPTGGPGTEPPAAPPSVSPPVPPPNPAPTTQPPTTQALPQAPADSVASPPTPPPVLSPAPPGSSQTQQTVSPPPTPQPGPATVPYHPMADRPFAKWLLYGSNTPVRDFLTNDQNLQIAQNTALGVTVGAAAIATGGMALQAAPGIFAGSALSAAAAPGAAPVLAGAAAIAAGNPQLTEQLEEEFEETVPALGEEIQEALPSTAERAATLFQDVTRQAQNLLQSNRDLVMELGGSSRGAPVTANQLGAAIGQYAEGNPGFARALGGNAMEALVNAIIEDLPPGEGSFVQVGGPGRIDFVGTGAYEGYTFELTTEAGVAEHALRAYMQEPGAMISTYLPIIE